MNEEVKITKSNIVSMIKQEGTPVQYGIYYSIYNKESDFIDSIEKINKQSFSNKLGYRCACFSSFKTPYINNFSKEGEYLKVQICSYSHHMIRKIIDQLNELINPVHINIDCYTESLEFKGKSKYGYESMLTVYSGESEEHIALLKEAVKVKVVTFVAVSFDFPETYTSRSILFCSLLLGTMIRNTSYEEYFYRKDAVIDEEDPLQQLLNVASGEEATSSHTCCEFKLTKDLIKVLGNADLINKVSDSYKGTETQTPVWKAIKNEVVKNAKQI